MQRLTLGKVLLIAISCLALVACSAKKTGANGTAAGDGLAQNGVQVHGVAGDASFQDQQNEMMAHRMQAPYDQTYYFTFDSDTVVPADIASLNVQAKYLVMHSGAKIRLEGNADERGSREYNVALGWRRAQAVAALLKAQGVASNQMALVSYGKEKPVAFGHDENAYRLNRRVNLVYEAK